MKNDINLENNNLENLETQSNHANDSSDDFNLIHQKFHSKYKTIFET